MKGSHLRDYQFEMKSRLFKAWRSHRSVMVQMPTGTGKTHVLASVIRDFLDEESRQTGDVCGRVWIIAHRRELVAQIEETVAGYGIGREDGTVRVMSIQWLARHWEDAGESPQLIVIDEAHHALADTYMDLWRRYPEARKLGMTATPCRMSRRGFADMFDVLLTSLSIAEFITRGQLSLFDYVSIRPDSEEQRLVDSLEKRGADGDYQIKEMNAVLNRKPGIERLYRSVEQFAPDKKGIVYAVSIGHARAIASYYRMQGLNAAAIDSRTPAAERKRLVGEFKEGRIKVLVNVDVFSEGFDCPDVEFVQMARPTLSLAKYLQQVGRGLRKSEGKDACVLIDNVGLYRVFGLPVVAWDWDAMFRGDMAGKGRSVSQLEKDTVCPEVWAGTPDCDCGMSLVMSRDRLLAELRERKDICPVRNRNVSELKAWQDVESGLWGLRRGRRKVTGAVFDEIFDIRYDMAAVRFPDRKCGVTDSSGEAVWMRRDSLSMAFTKDYFLTFRSSSGKEYYVDLHSLRTYDGKPEVKRYGGVELLKVGHVYYSRTRIVYVNKQHAGRLHIMDRGFYVTVFDSDVPVPCDCGSGYVCLLAGDYERFYGLHSRLADGSIVVRDQEGRYFHVKENGKKQLVGSGDLTHDVQACLSEIRRLSEGAKENMRMHETEKAERRSLFLRECRDAVPFRAGMKWGLKSGDRVIVPPIYRTVKPPVGRYCAVEMNYSQWGVIALDGRVMIEPKYTDVTIGDNETAVLTFVTGKKKAVRL
ncbi:MAG: DEAD/DEAH box helicase [Paraprevotella sp.]|nr:DEAD/DEAH box helicase [Paraprevotella sp.]